MPLVLMVAEKPSIAQSIASVLGGGRLTTRRKRVPVHEFPGTFEGRGCDFRVTAVTGHVFSTDFPPEYSNWDAVDPQTLFYAPVVKKENKGNMVRHLEEEARGADVLVLWLDCDREGENICMEVVDTVQPRAKRGLRVLRAKFSAVAKPDILKAMANLGQVNVNEALSVDARQELDLKVGVAFSRFQTRYFQGKYGDLDSTLVSYGPCQTPTLGFCVDRHDEIQTFQPESYWSLTASIFKTRPVDFHWSRGRMFDVEVVRVFQHLLAGERAATVKSVKETSGRKPRPLPLNTVEMLKAASKGLGMGPAEAMRAAEHLYLSGYVSYPRTETTTYPSTFSPRQTLGLLASHASYGAFVAELLGGAMVPARRGTDTGDHPPITPMRGGGGLSGSTAALYNMIVRHFIATVSPDCEYITTKVLCRVGSEEFSASGKRIISAGWTALVSGSALSDTILPEFAKGESLVLRALRVKEGQTSAPGYLTEAELIGMMEQQGIGTDASIPSHINNICTRNYVTIGTGRTLVPTSLGILLVHGYHKIDPDLVLPKIRASIEKQCALVAEGKASKEHVVAHSLEIFAAKFKYFVSRIGDMDSLFEVTFSKLEDTGKFLSKCGKCRRYMKYVPLRPQRLFCPTCNVTYSLPQNGTIKLYKEITCPLDNFQLVLYSLGNSGRVQGKSTPLCPYCYNNPPFEGLKAMSCDLCQHPSCRWSAARNAVCRCPGQAALGGSDDGRGEGGGYRGHGRGAGAGAGAGAVGRCPGSLVLDPNSKPNWKLACNRCNLIVGFHGTVHAMKPSKSERCDDCSSRKLIIDFHKDHCPLPEGEGTKLVGCVVCHELLNSMTEVKKGRTKHAALKKRGGGRGRGRGTGRGRGRGGGGKRKGKNYDPKMTFDEF